MTWHVADLVQSASWFTAFDEGVATRSEGLGGDIWKRELNRIVRAYYFCYYDDEPHIIFVIE